MKGKRIYANERHFMELPKIDLKNIEFPKVDIKKLKTALSEKTASGDNTEISFNKPDENKDLFMLDGRLADHGIDMWRQMFIGHNKETGDEKIFFIDFIAVNPGHGGPDPVFGQLPENKKSGKRPSYLMIHAGAYGEKPIQLQRYFGWDNVTIKADAPFLLSADNCFLSESRTLGMIGVSEEEAAEHPEWMTNAGNMIWDLKIDKKIAFNAGYGTGKVFRDSDASQIYWHVQGMKTEYSGDVSLNGVLYHIDPETSYGYADKSWGSDIAKPVICLSSSDLYDNKTGERLYNSAFTIGGGNFRVGPIKLSNKLMSAFWIEGRPYEFNFSKVWTMTRTVAKVKKNKNEIVWRIEQETPIHKVSAELRSPIKEMVRERYESPDGEAYAGKIMSGGSGTGEIRIYTKKISLKNKWEWELAEELTASHVLCEYGR